MSKYLKLFVPSLTGTAAVLALSYVAVGGLLALDGRMGELGKVTFKIPEGQHEARVLPAHVALEGDLQRRLARAPVLEALGEVVLEVLEDGRARRAVVVDEGELDARLAEGVRRHPQLPVALVEVLEVGHDDAAALQLLARADEVAAGADGDASDIRGDLLALGAMLTWSGYFIASKNSSLVLDVFIFCNGSCSFLYFLINK